MMMESIFSVLPSYFSIIFWSKVKSVNLLVCFSVIWGQNGVGQSDCRILNQINISLEQSGEIVYFCVLLWYQKLRVYRKILGWVWSKMVAATLVTRWMDEWMDELNCSNYLQSDYHLLDPINFLLLIFIHI